MSRTPEPVREDLALLADIATATPASAPLASIDPSLTVEDGAVRLVAKPSNGHRATVQLYIDDVTVHLHVMDPASATARAVFTRVAPEAHRSAVAAGLLILAERLALHPKGKEANAPASPGVVLRPVELWADDVVPADVFDMLVLRLVRHVHLPPHAAVVVAAWVMLTYLLDVLPVAPILWVYSPTRGCGKSVLLDLVSLLAARTLKADNATVAALFRLAGAHRATLILDEVDQWMTGDRAADIAGLLNASFTRGGTFVRTVGDDHEPRAFDVFSFRAVGGIGRTLHDTTRSRSLRVAMERAPAGGLPDPLQVMYAEAWAAPLRQHIAKAAHQLRERMASRLADADATPYPAHFDGRARDAWLTVLALGHELGGVWLGHLTAACEAMSRAAAADVSDLGEILLTDIRQCFAERQNRPIQPTELLAWLIEQEASPWGDYRHGRALTSRGLATLLQRFKIESDWGRLDGEKKRVFRAEQFRDAWASYLPVETEDTNPPVEPSHTYHLSNASGQLGGVGTRGTAGTHPRAGQTKSVAPQGRDTGPAFDPMNWDQLREDAA